MAPQSVLDAAAISPYPFVVRQGRGAPSTPENEDRGPHPKGKKAKGRRPERNRQDEEPRFNIGPPRNFRNPVNRSNRRGFLNRLPGQWYPEDPNVPDYPPPSFQEAMTTPPVSVCSSTTSLIPQPTIPLAIPEIIPEHPEAPTETEPVSTLENTSSEIIASDDATDSDESLYVIDPKTVPVGSTDIPKAPSRLKGDWRRLRGPEFLQKSFKESSNKHDDEKPKLHRIRTIISPKVLVDIDPDVSMTKIDSPSPISNPKRKLMSLSPLKTIFPRSPAQQDRETLSAIPSPSSSPYPTSRSVFFRSSTSLASASFLRLPLLSSTASSKSEPLSRKIFKGKERARDPESIDAWEVLSEDAYEGVDSDGNETIDHHRSLMSAVESFKNPAVNSAARVHRLAFDSQVADNLAAQQRAVAQFEDGKEVENSGLFHASQEATLRDWRSPGTLFIERPVNRGRSAMSAFLENSGSNNITTSSPMSSTVDLASLPPGPPLTTVRVRNKSPSPQPPMLRHANQTVHLSPLRVDATPNPVFDEQSGTAEALYQRALDTPLPMTPVYHNHFDYGGIPAADQSMDPTPTSDREVSDLLTHSDSISAHARSSVTPAELTIAAHPSTTTLLGPAFVKEPMTPTRHHYVGRPLPRPPAPAPAATATRVGVVDSIYSSSESSGHGHSGAEQNGRSDNSCPEGLLIDLEDTSLDSNPPTGTSTPLPDEELFHSVSMSPALSSTADLLQLVDPPLPFNSIQGANSPPCPESPNAHHLNQSLQRNNLSEVTDLDLLMSRLAENESHNGSDYDTLLLVSELIGPASPSFRTQSFQIGTSSRASPSDNMSLIGRIEVKRRRVLHDGRVKVKLTLLDVAVDKCGICLSQFRDADMAALTSACQHSFHETCLGRWFARSKTCPLCRVPLDTEVR